MKGVIAFKGANVAGGELSCSEEERKGLEGRSALVDGKFVEEVRKGGQELQKCVERLAGLACMLIPGGGMRGGMSGFMAERR